MQLKLVKRYIPILSWLPKYQKKYLASDIGAGITVGIILIPQGMAYAMIAGLPPVFGLYAALFPQIIYAFMGTSRQLAVGPVAMDSLLVAAGLGSLSIIGISDYISMAIFLAFFMGIIQLLMGLLKMGVLVNFLSKPVISGFTSAAAIIIGLSQLKHIFGINIERSSLIHEVLKNCFIVIHETHFLSLGIGLLTILMMSIGKKWYPKIPAAILVVVVGIITTYFFKLNTQGLEIVGAIPEGLPSLKLPSIDFAKVSSLFPIALTLALISFMEAISVAKAVEEKHQTDHLDPNQELIALGSANIIGSLFQSYPVTGGFSRTAVNDQTGAKTGISAIISSLIVGITLLFLTPLFYYLPKAVLGAIIIVAVLSLIDFTYPKRLYKNRKDEFFLLISTFIITLTIGIKEGILLGVLISLLLLVYRTSHPHIAILGKIENTPYFKNRQRFKEYTQIDPEVLIIRFDAQLFFGNKDYFKLELYKNMRKKTDTLKLIILDASSINYIDSSAVSMLKQIINALKNDNILFFVAGAIGPIRDIFTKSDLMDLIGKHHLFVCTQDAYNFYKKPTSKTKTQEIISLQTNKTNV